MLYDCFSFIHFHFPSLQIFESRGFIIFQFWYVCSLLHFENYIISFIHSTQSTMIKDIFPWLETLPVCTFHLMLMVLNVSELFVYLLNWKFLTKKENKQIKTYNEALQSRFYVFALCYLFVYTMCTCFTIFLSSDVWWTNRNEIGRFDVGELWVCVMQ